MFLLLSKKPALYVIRCNERLLIFYFSKFHSISYFSIWQYNKKEIGKYPNSKMCKSLCKYNTLTNVKMNHLLVRKDILR